MTSLVSSECDDIFTKALRLLHSRAKDSADQLKLMLDDVLAQKGSKDVKFAENTIRKGKYAIETAVIKSANDVKKEAEKRLMPSDRNKSDSFESLHPPEKKRLIESPQTSRSTSSSPTHNVFSNKSIADNKMQIKIEEDSEATDIEDESTDAGEFAALLELACIICKQIDISPSNQLVECQECHKLYHQECHTPPVANHDVSDPRLVWYCAKCTKTLKKIATKPAKGNNKSPVQTPTSSSTVSPLKEFTVQSSKASVKSEPMSFAPFKREHKTPIPSNMTMTNVSTSSVSNRPIGLAALAASSRASVATSAASVNSKTKSNNGNGTPTVSTGTSLLSSNDKKTQNLKKTKTLKQTK